MTTKTIDDLRTVTIKAGTSSLQAAHGPIDMRTVRGYARNIAEAWFEGRRIVFVTSGATSLGLHELGIPSRKEGEELGIITFAASVGQPLLMETYRALFRDESMHVAQNLASTEIIENHQLRERFINDVQHAFRRDTIVIVNENDPFATVQTTLGDNDALAAEISSALKVDALVLLSQKNGAPGMGGANTKREAIRKVHSEGILALVLDGKQPDVIAKFFRGDEKVFNDGIAAANDIAEISQ